MAFVSFSLELKLSDVKSHEYLRQRSHTTNSLRQSKTLPAVIFVTLSRSDDNYTCIVTYDVTLTDVLFIRFASVQA